MFCDRQHLARYLEITLQNFLASQVLESYLEISRQNVSMIAIIWQAIWI